MAFSPSCGDGQPYFCPSHLEFYPEQIWRDYLDIWRRFPMDREDTRVRYPDDSIAAQQTCGTTPMPHCPRALCYARCLGAVIAGRGDAKIANVELRSYGGLCFFY